MYAAVTSHGQALCFAHPAPQERPEPAWAALDNDRAAIAWTPPWLRDDDALLHRHDWHRHPQLWRYLSYRLCPRLQAQRSWAP